MMRIAQGLIIELAQSHGPCQNIADFQLIVDIVADEAVALGSSDRDLHEGMLRGSSFRVIRTCLERRRRDRIGPGDQAVSDLEIQHNVLACIEEWQLRAVRALKADRFRCFAGGCDLCDHELDRAGMPLVGDIADRIHICKRGRSRIKCLEARLGDAGGSCDVFQKILDFHPCASFLAMSSSTFFAALRPLVTAGPGPPWCARSRRCSRSKRLCSARWS